SRAPRTPGRRAWPAGRLPLRALPTWRAREQPRRLWPTCKAIGATSSTSRVVYRYHDGGMQKFLTAAVLIVLTAGMTAADRPLDFYFIDVEGGQSTLIVTPARQTLLVDTGYPERDGRDPDRIMAAMRDAKVTSIDYLLITHMHEDHNGGAAELARRVPIGAF